MQYETIQLSEADGIAVLTLDRPDHLNAMTTQMRAELLHAVKDVQARAKVLVLTGAGRAFCSGQDLGDAASAGRIDLERALRDEYGPLILALDECPIPTIAAVNGAAAGAGANVALACDVVIAAESAYFLQAFTRIGLIPDAGGTWSMPRRMGLAKAMGASLFAERIPAAKAEAWGLIWEAVPDAEFEAHWRGRAAHLAQGPTMAYRAVKEALRASDTNTLSEQLNVEAHLQGKCGHSRDFKEGVLAFTEKRAAKFEGR
ncbi:enoyl-CoA hydratase-related protein [Pseudaestuariivita atlantica]|uniref:Enoyl-CoA hydratase n=1 Tax=Pseudaestuariivita atlantica TaxID=1317121 RepID=A0A0L1JMK6_9RHOB|nr:enoyl-CoA hydratase-related protein [Pseudaestuariivita atlantica]KNG92986.1 enoyl-CoA hydratase [Pseudaestuariivita atlantica]